MALTVTREFTDPNVAPTCSPTVRQVCDDLLAPRAAAAEEAAEFPREVFRTLGAAGLLGLPFPEEFGGGGLPLHDYLQMIEELAVRLGHASAWVSACTRCRASRWPRSAATSSGSAGSRTCSAATCWAPTACPSRRRVGRRGAGHQGHRDTDSATASTA